MDFWTKLSTRAKALTIIVGCLVVIVPAIVSLGDFLKLPGRVDALEAAVPTHESDLRKELDALQAQINIINGHLAIVHEAISEAQLDLKLLGCVILEKRDFGECYASQDFLTEKQFLGGTE